jgi:hypothetical protein
MNATTEEAFSEIDDCRVVAIAVTHDYPSREVEELQDIARTLPTQGNGDMDEDVIDVPYVADNDRWGDGLTSITVEDRVGECLDMILDRTQGYYWPGSTLPMDALRSIMGNCLLDIDLVTAAASRDDLDGPTLTETAIDSPEAEHVPMECQNPASNSNGARPSGGSMGRPRKNPRDEDDNDDGAGDDSEKKRVKLSGQARSNMKLCLPCPFRVKNPRRFNVEDHNVCALRRFTRIEEVR